MPHSLLGLANDWILNRDFRNNFNNNEFVAHKKLHNDPDEIISYRIKYTGNQNTSRWSTLKTSIIRKLYCPFIDYSWKPFSFRFGNTGLLIFIVEIYSLTLFVNYSILIWKGEIFQDKYFVIFRVNVIRYKLTETKDWNSNRDINLDE